MIVPVIVGVGRITQKPQQNLENALNEIQLARIATEFAFNDAGIVAKDIDRIVYIQSLSDVRPYSFTRNPRYDNPGLSLARSLGIPHTRCFQSEIGGNMPQSCINECAERIVHGEFETVLITGAEALDTLKRALRKGFCLDNSRPTSETHNVLHWGEITGVSPEMMGSNAKILGIHEVKHNIAEMPVAYSLIEQALRISDNVSAKDRNESNGRMFSAFSTVAALQENKKHSWFPTPRSPKEITTVTESNRDVAYPYSKLCCAIMDVNQAASVILMSESKALALRIPQEKLVYLHGSADSNDVAENVVQKPQLDRCTGMKIVGDQCFANANLKPRDISFFDIYSCFPVAVRLACREMNLPLNPEDGGSLTITGGLPFHGGPGNNYVTHSIVAMVEKLRSNPSTYGLVTANGGILSKHSAGIYSTTHYSVTHPGQKYWVRPDCAPFLQAERKATPPRRVAVNANNSNGNITNYSIKCNSRSQPIVVIALGDIISGVHKGERFLATTDDKAIVENFYKNKDDMANTLVSLFSVNVNGKWFKTSFTIREPSKL